MIKQYTFNIEDLNIEVSRIEQMMGYENSPSPEPFNGIIKTCLNKINNDTNIQGGFKLFADISFNKSDKSIIINSKPFYLEDIIYHKLKESDKIAVFVCTAGKGLTELSKQKANEGFLVESYTIDLIGSIIAESAMDIIQKKFNDEMNLLNLHTTNRYSPGYCGWLVSGQHNLFSLLPPRFCNVTINDTALMSPIKSISGFIGVGKKVKFRNYTCNTCNKMECIFNQNKEQTKV